MQAVKFGVWENFGQNCKAKRENTLKGAPGLTFNYKPNIVLAKPR